MLRVLHRCLLVTLLTLSVGFHWAFLQSLAWTGMVVRYSQGTSLSEALRKTFDGQHPCSICRLVEEGRSHESQPAVLKVESKIELALAPRIEAFLHRPSDPVLPRSFETCIPALRAAPPVPPPRFV